MRWNRERFAESRDTRENGVVVQPVTIIAIDSPLVGDGRPGGMHEEMFNRVALVLPVSGVVCRRTVRQALRKCVVVGMAA